VSQETRNKIYAAIAGLVPVLVTFGLITSDDAARILSLADGGLILAAAVLGFVGAVIAFIKSRTKTTTTIDVPKATVVEVVTTAGHANVDSDSNPVG